MIGFVSLTRTLNLGGYITYISTRYPNTTDCWREWTNIAFDCPNRPEAGKESHDLRFDLLVRHTWRTPRTADDGVVGGVKLED